MLVFRFVLAAATLSLVLSAAAPVQAASPNIIFIMADDI
jgi:hypothetical protein